MSCRLPIPCISKQGKAHTARVAAVACSFGSYHVPVLTSDHDASIMRSVRSHAGSTARQAAANKVISNKLATQSLPCTDISMLQMFG